MSAQKHGGGAIFLMVLMLGVQAIVAPRPWLASKALIVAGGIVFPVLALSALLVYTFRATTAMSGADALTIEVVAHQWWWRVRYPELETANKIRIPAGRPVELVLRTRRSGRWSPS